MTACGHLLPKTQLLFPYTILSTRPYFSCRIVTLSSLKSASKILMEIHRTYPLSCQEDFPTSFLASFHKECSPCVNTIQVWTRSYREYDVDPFLILILILLRLFSCWCHPFLPHRLLFEGYFLSRVNFSQFPF